MDFKRNKGQSDALSSRQPYSTFLQEAVSTASRRNLKRKSPEDGALVFPLNELNQDLLERVLSWLPTSTFLKLSSVSKRCKSAVTSPVFHSACSQIPSRDPWFYIVDSSQSSNFKNQQHFVYDSSEMNWKFFNYPSNFLEEKQQNDSSNLSSFLPVAASGGLLCFHNQENDVLVVNPVTCSFRKLPSFDYSDTLCAIGMISVQESYNVFLVFGEIPNLSFRMYNSITNIWEESAVLSRKSLQSCSTDDDEEDDDRMLYFLSKCGNVVATEIQKTPCKQYSSIATTKGNGQEILCFLNSSGKVMVCNLAEKHFYEYPRLLPLHHEYSIDLVLAMPAAISHEFYGKKVDINCTSGTGGQMFVCFSNSFDESCSLGLKLPWAAWCTKSRVSRVRERLLMQTLVTHDSNPYRLHKNDFIVEASV
ncbi:hypothetical protein RND71_016357 [Anisodus tanguticus]|uniref:F-box domain-containing protein n=1 Tax=Anisodus tanguticus TaxID=243964 RepID=A0AAE1S8C3_9SOLA|nr:hypothetical protein RND71_016357 [Anisodus tanguticus]